MAKKKPPHLSAIPGGRQPTLPDTDNHSLEAEQAVLGGLMLDGEGWHRVCPLVAAKDFYRTDHRLIFEAVRTLETQGSPFDPVTLSEALEARGELQDAGGMAYLAALARDTPSAANLDAYARIVRRYSLIRQRAAAWHQGEFDRIALLTDEITRLETGARRPLLEMIEEEDTAAWFDTPPPPRRYLVADYLPAGIEGMITAPGGTGKGFITISLALAVAAGLPFLRQEVQETGGVLMLQAEDDADEINRRIARAVEAVREDPEADLQGLRQKLGKNLMARSVRGMDTRLVERDEAGNASQTPAVDRIIAQARQFQEVRGVPLKLIILDPFASFFGLEENSNGDANLFITAVRRISAETGATVLFVHHSNKEAARRGELSQGNSRGASALTDGVRWQMSLAAMSETEAQAYGIAEAEAGHHVKAKVTKSNYTSPQGLQWLKRRPGGYLDPIDLERVEDLEKDAKAQKLGQEVKHKLACAIGRGEEYSKRAFAEKFAQELGAGRQRVERIIGDLVAAGELVEARPKTYQRNVKVVLRLPSPPAAEASGVDVQPSQIGVQDAHIDVQIDVQPLTSNDVQNGIGRHKPPESKKLLTSRRNDVQNEVGRQENSENQRVLDVQASTPPLGGGTGRPGRPRTPQGGAVTKGRSNRPADPAGCQRPARGGGPSLDGELMPDPNPARTRRGEVQREIDRTIEAIGQALDDGDDAAEEGYL